MMLKVLDLIDYETAFVNQGFGMNDIVNLTKEDMIELGLPIGSRNRLLSFQQVLKNSQR
jgi:hypothetical protein